jgi:hypothetical protein
VTVRLALIGVMTLLPACSGTAPAPPGPESVGGTVERLDGLALTLATSTGPVRVQLEPSTPVANVVATDRAHITDGSFLGIGSVTASDGSQRAVDVTAFPEALRGTDEGSYPWNRPGVDGGGKMTNGREERPRGAHVDDRGCDDPRT